MSIPQESNPTVNLAGFTLLPASVEQAFVQVRTYLHQESGLHVHFIPLAGRHTQYVGFLVPFGANSLSFKTRKGTVVPLPAGCAHYLEHCVFSRDEEGGLLGRLAALGADANAYTTYTHTLYYLTCVEKMPEAFAHLYRAVLQPQIDQERVDVERSIIAAELAMYQDDPDVCMYQTLLEKLFAVHPQRYDICGTDDSIQAITASDLMQIVQAYYQPNQIEICFAGALDEEQYLLQVAALLEDTRTIWHKQDDPINLPPAEPATVYDARRLHLQKQVGVPSFLVGIKDPSALPQRPLAGRDILVKRLSGAILAEIFLGEGSEFYQNLLDEGLINDTFSAQYICEKDCTYWVLGGESRQPERVLQRLQEYLPQLVQQPLTDSWAEKKLHLEKRALLGSFWRSLDSVSSCGSGQLRVRLLGLDLAEQAETLRHFQLDASVLASLAVLDNYVFLTMAAE